MQCLQDVTPVIAMSGSSSCHHTSQVTRHDDIRIRPAHPFLGSIPKWVYPAGSHGADTAACAQLAVAALGFLFCQAVPNRFNSFTMGNIHHCPGILVNAVFLIPVSTE